ncbi:MAG: hypothetical protein EBR82_60715 [Caulobacteraceae bacterium]|nr:hypothetical protein [Caulobacteraceae bacterium]
MAMSTPVQGVSHIFAGLQAMTGDKGLSNGNFMATGRGFHEQYQIAEQDARYAAELKEQKNEQRLEELRKSYDFVIRFLEDEQSALHDAVREAIDNNDVPAARNALKSLSDNRARVAGYQFNKGIVEAQPTDAFSTVGAYLNNLPQLAQNIRNSQREISPIEKELRRMETSQRIAAELRADEQSNRGRIQAGAAVGAAGSVTAEAIGAAIKSGIESGNAQSALRGLGLSLAGSFTDALTRESVIRPLTRMFNRLGDEIANGGMRAGASIYQAAIAGASILQVSQRKKKVGPFSILGAAAAFYLSGGNPSATAAGYTAGNSLDNRDVGGAVVSTGLAYASGQFSGGSSPTDSQWSAQNLPGNSRAVQITNNYGVVNDKADATRIVNLQIKQLYNATAVGS